MITFKWLTGNLHGKGVAADSDEVEGHALHRHPPAGRPDGEDALHLHSPVLLPLHLHRGSLERDRHLQPRVIFIAPASLQRTHSQTKGPRATVVGQSVTSSVQ